MRSTLLFVFLQLALLAEGRLFADIVTLKDGSQTAGAVESGNTQELHVKAGDRSQTIDIHEVQTIQLGGSAVKPAAGTPPGKADSAPDQPNSLVLNDGAHISGRWWSIDATKVHFLVNNELRDYPRSDVFGVTFGNATLTLPSAPAPPPAPTPAPPAASAAPAPRSPNAPRPSTDSAPQSPKAARPPASTPASAPSGARTQPDEIGMVYSWNGKVVTPLERTRAVARGSGAKQYWEIPGAQSRVRLHEGDTLVFVVGLQEGIDPSSYILYPLDSVEGSRRTRSQPGRGAGLMTWPVEIVKQHEASVSTYVFTVKDLPTGEYSFSPSSSNEGFCFGVDQAPGQ